MNQSRPEQFVSRYDISKHYEFERESETTHWNTCGCVDEVEDCELKLPLTC